MGEPWMEFFEACNARDPEAIKLIEDGRLGIDECAGWRVGETIQLSESQVMDQV